MFAFTAPSACVGVPFSVGQTGTVLAPFVCLVVTFASSLGAYILHYLALKYDCSSLPELGWTLGGDTGRIFGGTIQLGNFLLYMPVALLVCAQALQGALDPKGAWLSGCIDYWILIVSLICLATSQLRSLSNTTALSFISLGCVVWVVFSLIYVVWINEVPGDERNDALLVGNPDMVGSSSDSLKGWTNFALGVSTTAWAFVPSFLAVELSNKKVMESPQDFPKAIVLVAILNILVYCGVGVFVTNRWGYDVDDPVMLFHAFPDDDLKSRILNLFWFLACLISYALDSVPLVASCQRVWAPNFDVDNDWSLTGICVYLLISLPSFFSTIVMALFVPSLFCMLAIVTALTVPWVNLIYPAYLHNRNAKRLGKNKIESSSSAKLLGDGEEGGLGEDLLVGGGGSMDDNEGELSRKAVLFVLFMGVFLFLICTVAAIGKLGIHELRGPIVVGCNGWTILDID